LRRWASHRRIRRVVRPLGGRKSRRARLADTGDAPLVVVAPGALLPAKKWPAAHFARLIDLLRETMPLRAVLVGAPADARDAAATAAATKERCSTCAANCA
jgi:ADP-heptose:LPS heptosyltransferase